MIWCKVKVGQIWYSEVLNIKFRVTRIDEHMAYAIMDGNNTESIFAVLDNGRADFGSTPWTLSYLDENGIEQIDCSWNKKQIEKVIPDMPLDPTLPILQAGYLQDRQRKQYRSK
jgi:hypothetical protein